MPGILKKVRDSDFLHFSNYKLPTEKHMRAVKTSARVRLRRACLPRVKSRHPYCAKGLLYMKHYPYGAHNMWKSL